MNISVLGLGAGKDRRTRPGPATAGPGSTPDPAQARRGQSLVEFALVVPLFLLLVAGMVDFGLALYSNLTSINAAREGARLGVTYAGDTAAIEARVRSMAAGLNQADLGVFTTCERPDAAPATTFHPCTAPLWQSGDATVVRVTYTYRMVWPLMLGTQIPLSSTVRMRIE